MDIRTRLVGPCATRTQDLETVVVDLGALVRRIILFDHYIFQSIRLEEFPILVRAFGYAGVKALLDSGILSVQSDILTLAQIGQSNIGLRDRKGLLPLGSYSFVVLTVADREQYIHEAFGEVEGIEGLTGRQRIRLKGKIANRLIERPANAGKLALAQTELDLEHNVSNIKLATARTLASKLRAQIDPNDFSLKVHRIDETDFRVESNVAERFGLSEQETHKQIELALLAVGRVNQRIEDMKQYTALSGARDDDLPVLEEKFGFLERQLSAESQETTLHRVITIAGLPELPEDDSDQGVNLARLVDISRTPECQQFRQWLRSIEDASDDDIRDQFHPIRERISAVMRGRPGKAVRLLATSAAGLVPEAGLILAPALDVLDTFVVDELISKPGPLTFLSRMYPSIFEPASTD